MTNSGGVTEKVNIEKLAMRLGDISFNESQIVQSHTPFHALVNEYRDKTILVLGGFGDNVRDVASAYGFRSVVTSSDLARQDERLNPFPEMTKAHHAKYGRKQDAGQPLQVSAILVWSSPRDWCLDLQVTLDLLLSSKGVFNTRSDLNGNSDLPNNGFLQDEQPKLFFCNPDFEWATKHQHPRLAQGAFREALCGIWKQATNGAADLKFTMYGKPSHTTYQYGERALQNLLASSSAFEGKIIEKVFMIGDNVFSDIAGANTYQSEAGYRWLSVLVKTGVYRAGTIPVYTPNYIAKDVGAAVEWAIAHSD